MQNGIYRVAYIHSVIVLKCRCTEHWECSESLLLLWAFSDLRSVEWLAVCVSSNTCGDTGLCLHYELTTLQGRQTSLLWDRRLRDIWTPRLMFLF